MQLQKRFKSIKLHRLKTNQLIYTLKDIQEISDLPSDRINRILNSKGVKPDL